MVLRRRAWLSHEGWYYVAVLAFIVGGAVLRSVNLLVVLAGMMIAPLLLNWRVVMAALRGIEVRRKTPPQICAGDPLTIELSVTNHRRWLGSWLLVLEDRLQPKAGLRRGERATVARALIPQLPPGQTVTATYRLNVPRRGLYRLGPLRISTRFPLGLVRATLTLPIEDTLVVAPRLGVLSEEWSQIVEADVAGDDTPHAQRGIDEGDYYSLRPFRSGDARRWIHWRTTAKLNVPIVRQFERQRSFDVAMLIDPWLPEKPTDDDRGRLEFALSLAATAIADLCGEGKGELTIVVATPVPQVWSGPTSHAYCREVFGHLAALEGQPASDVPAAIFEARREFALGGRLLVISTRSLEAAGQTSGGDVDNVCWIDVTDPELAALFSLP